MYRAVSNTPSLLSSLPPSQQVFPPLPVFVCLRVRTAGERKVKEGRDTGGREAGWDKYGQASGEENRGRRREKREGESRMKGGADMNMQRGSRKRRRRKRKS